MRTLFLFILITFYNVANAQTIIDHQYNEDPFTDERTALIAIVQAVGLNSANCVGFSCKDGVWEIFFRPSVVTTWSYGTIMYRVDDGPIYEAIAADSNYEDLWRNGLSVAEEQKLFKEMRDGNVVHVKLINYDGTMQRTASISLAGLTREYEKAMRFLE